MIRITFAENGTGHCLYTERLDLKEIGSLRVKRASNIEFDDARQLWVVSDLEGRELYSNGSRDKCVGWEGKNLV